METEESNEVFRVTFHYTIDIVATSEETAEEMAAVSLEDYLDEVEFRRFFVRNMSATVDKISGK